MSFESADVLPGRASVWQVQPEGRGGFTKYCAVAACTETATRPPVKLASAQLEVELELLEEEEKRLVGGELY